MSILSNQVLAIAISGCDCGNLETINNDSKKQLDPGKAIYVVPVGSGGTGVNSETEDNIVDTLVQITEINTRLVNTWITTDYEIVSQNGFPN